MMFYTSMNDDVVYKCGSKLLPQHNKKCETSYRFLQYQIVTFVQMTSIHTTLKNKC